jgi:hypothetical protein
MERKLYHFIKTEISANMGKCVAFGSKEEKATCRGALTWAIHQAYELGHLFMNYNLRDDSIKTSCFPDM